MSHEHLDHPVHRDGRAPKDISAAYRSEVAKFAFQLGLPDDVKREMMCVVARIVRFSARQVRTAAAEKYVEAFEKLEDKEILVGLDRNPKAAAVMTKNMYWAGMQGTYAKATAHYTVITDPVAAKGEIERADQQIWNALPK